jgi:hypothetical protein
MRPRLLGGLALLILIGAGLYLSFELGRYRSGFSLLDARRRSELAATELADREARIDQLERQIAILETSRDIDRETYADVEANLAELEARIQAQEEELGFYRGIVSPGDGIAGLRVQSVELMPGEGDAAYLLRVLLVQAIVHNDRLTGSLQVVVRGEQAGEAVEFGLDELGSETRGAEIPYGFQYFQSLEVPLSLPQGFAPAELEIQVWPGSPRGETIVQSYPWQSLAG